MPETSTKISAEQMHNFLYNNNGNPDLCIIFLLQKYLGEEMTKSPSSLSMQRNTSFNELQNGHDLLHKTNIHFMKKIPAGAEASNILVGEVDFLEKTLSAFIRLNDAAIMGNLTEVPVPTRYNRFCFTKKKDTSGLTPNILQISFYITWTTR